MMSQQAFQKIMSHQSTTTLMRRTMVTSASRAVARRGQQTVTASTIRSSNRFAHPRAANMATATLNKPPTLPNPFRGGFGSGKNGRFFNFSKMSANTKRNLALGLGLTGALQYQYGTADNFFEHKFQTKNAHPDDLADFYGTEDIMEIFCVLPFMMNLMMRQATFDDDGNIHAWGLMGPGELEVSVIFTDESDDDDDDGENKSLPWFNKRETFKDVAPSFLGGFTLWEMTINFGYRQIDEDGTCEITHNGERFKGFFPIRFIFDLHSRYVIWATERYLNSPAFGSDDDDLEDVAQQQRHNIPLYAFKEFIGGLTEEIQKQKDELPTTEGSIEKKRELDVTLQRLKTISVNIERRKTTLRMRRTKTAPTTAVAAATATPIESSSVTPQGTTADLDVGVNIPKIRTIQRHNTVVRKEGENSEKIQLIVEDKEMRDTIQTAMKQIQDANSTTSSLSSTGGQQQLQQKLTKPFIVRRQTK